MGFALNMLRLWGGSPSIDQPIDDWLASDPNDLAGLFALADTHWRRKSWGSAVVFAQAVLEFDPKNFHALAIAATSNGHLSHWYDAKRYAEKLLSAKQPNWTLTKFVLAVMTARQLLSWRTRPSYLNGLRRCEEERAADVAARDWAKHVVSLPELSGNEVAA